MASDAEADAAPRNGVDEPATPREPLPSSQLTLPSTEVPASPLDASQSVATEAATEAAAADDDGDDGPAAVVPSSLTPPPSTQAPTQAPGPPPAGPGPNARSQQSALFSPPATVLYTSDAIVAADADYVPPTPHQMLDASPDELRAMLLSCLAEHQKLKMETAHHKLQYNLLCLQADEDSKRAAVEHDMVRREVDALRLAEHARQARRELSAASDSAQAKYLQMKAWYEEAVDDNDALSRRLRAAKKVIQQKEEETMNLADERDVLLTRIRENREHFHMLCSPGGIFHSAMTPKLPSAASPQQTRAAAAAAAAAAATAHRATPRSARRDDADGPEHGLSALLQAMSQDNNSAPSTPKSTNRGAQRSAAKHSRNAQSMSSLPTTPLNRTRDASLLPSLDLPPHTEPRYRLSQHHFAPRTPTPKRDRRRKSRESTISVDDNEELARQAVETAAAAMAQSTTPQALQAAPAVPPPRRVIDDDDDDDDDGGGGGGGDDGGDDGDDDGGDDDDGMVFGSRASRTAAEMLRRNPGGNYEVASAARARDDATEKSARMQARLLAASPGALDKRKSAGDDGRREQGSPAKRMRVGGPLAEDPRVGLGIQYGR